MGVSEACAVGGCERNIKSQEQAAAGDAPAAASTMDELGSCTKSVDTTASEVYPNTPFIVVSLLSLSMAITSAYVASLAILKVRSTTLTSAVGTRNDMPVILPLRCGSTCRETTGAVRERKKNG